MTLPFKLAFSAFILSTALVACPGGAPDTTPPTIIGHTPGVNAGNVSARDPISVTFSKAIKASSIDGESVILAGAAGVAIARTASLSADGRTLTVSPSSLPAVPNALTLELTAAVTDTSGNALAPASWTWTLPDWLTVGGALNAVSSHDVEPPVLALDAAGKPVVSFSETDGSNSNVYTWRWTGAAWQALGGALNLVSGHDAFLAGLVVDAGGSPIVSIPESDGARLDLYVQRWDGNAWRAVGGPVNPVFGQSISLTAGLALRPDGNPVMAIEEFDGMKNKVYAPAWTGSAWEPLGGPLNLAAGTRSFGLGIAANAAGAIALASEESDGAHSNLYVQRWDGAAWQPLGGAINAVSGHDPYGPFVALDPAGSPVVAFTESDGARVSAYAARWTGSAWAYLGTGVPSSGTSADARGVAVDANGNVVVAAFAHTSASNFVVVQRWNGSGWQPVGSSVTGPGGVDASPSGLVLDANGAPVIAYTAVQNGVRSAYVTRYNQ